MPFQTTNIMKYNSERNYVMKKLLAIIFVFVFLFAAISCEGEEEAIRKFEEMSNEELGELYKSIDKYPENFIDDELKDKYTGLCHSSASSPEEALDLADRSGINTETRIDIETDYYYGIYTKWPSAKSGEYVEEYTVCFKKDAFDYSANTWHFGISDKPAVMEKMINYYCYREMYDGYGGKIIYAEMEENDEAFIYSVYWGYVSGGDSEHQDEVTILKSTFTINKETMTVDVGSVDGDLSVTEYGTIYLDGGSLN